MDIRSYPYVKLASTRYRSLESRDRFALLGLAGFLGLLLLYYGVWVPANNFFESQLRQRDREFALIRYMRSSESLARAAKAANAQPVSGQALLTQISQTAQQFHINPNRLQPEGSDGVSVWFDDVPFNDLVRWLALQSQRGVIIHQISIDREADAGKVNARILLRS